VAVAVAALRPAPTLVSPPRALRAMTATIALERGHSDGERLWAVAGRALSVRLRQRLRLCRCVSIGARSHRFPQRRRGGDQHVIRPSRQH